MSTSIILAILVTSLATYLSRFLGVISSEKIKENSKIFRWFNCLAYSTLAALIARIIIFPSGILSEVDYYQPIVYPSFYFNIKLSSYIEMHQSFEKNKYIIKHIDRNEMLSNKIFRNFINTIAKDIYYPIDIHGKSVMQIDSLDRLNSLMRDLRVLEPL